MVLSFIKKLFIGKSSQPVDYSDDDLVGHASFSDNDDSEEDENEMPDYMADFYEETTFSPEWLALTDEEKSSKLDEDLGRYMKEGREKILDQIRS